VFTVIRHGGTVDVTLRQLERGWSASERAALQRRLRAAGVPAVVGFHGVIVVEPDRLPASLHPAIKCYPSPRWKRIFTVFHKHGVAGTSFPRGVAYQIHPARIPKGARIIIPIESGKGPHGEHGVSFLVGGLVIMPSGRCLI
jgi:hypothetical protein